MLESDPGDGSQVILTEFDTDGTSCIDPEYCPGPVVPDCGLLLEPDTDQTQFFLLEFDTSGTNVIEPESCAAPPTASDFELLSGAGDDFEYLSSPSDLFEFLD